MQRPNHRPQNNSPFKDSDKAFFKTMFWNAGGLTNVKFLEIKEKIYKNDSDILGIVEAGAATDNIQYFPLPGYQVYTLSRARQVASGIIVAVKTSIVADFNILKEYSPEDKLEAVELKAWKEGIHKRFLVVYNPPRNQPDLTWLNITWSRNCVLYGDINAPSTLWGYTNTDAVGKIFEEFIKSSPVEHIENDQSSPTFLSFSGSQSHPDVILSHSSLALEIINTLSPAPGGFGHKILLVNILAKSTKRQEQRLTRWNTKKANWPLYTAQTDEYLTDMVIGQNVDSTIKNITEVIRKCALIAVPRGQVKRYTPFWNEYLQSLKEERDEARSGVEEDNNRDNRIRLKRKTAKFKREIKKAKRDSYKKFLGNLDFRRDGKKAHSFLSKMNNQKETKNNPIKKGSKLLTAEEDIARYFCKHYSNTSNFRPDKKNAKPNTTPATFQKDETNQVLWEKIQPAEMEAALTTVKKGKSAGPDDILPEFLINLGCRAKLTLLKALNQVWENHYPCEWRKAEIIPILKKGKNADSPKNFRPIALTSVISKLFERILVSRLENFLAINGSCTDKQAGFKRNRNTIEHVARFSQEVKDGFHRKQSTLAVFIDFKTAFDRVWRRKLLSKLIEKGVNGYLYQSIASFLAQRFIRVRYQNTISRYKQTRQGLPQGSVLSPSLFKVMMDDVISALESEYGISALLYADDLLMWATSSNVKSLEHCLNTTLEKLNVWANSNEMIVNPQKTEFQLFTLSTKSFDIHLHYNHEALSRTDGATYLGIKLDKKLNWSKHIEKQINQATKRMSLMKRLAGIKWGATQDVLSQAYKSYVRPVMEYGTELTITAPQNSLKKIDTTQNQALRLITGSPRSTPIVAMEFQANVEPLQTRREYLALCMLERIKRINIPYWSHYRPATGRLKSQINFYAEVENIMQERGLQFDSRQSFPSPWEQIAAINLPYNLHLVYPVSKETSPPHELKAYTLATIAERYPEDEWLHVYTDGSAIGANMNAGAGVYSKHFRVAAPVGRKATNYEGEVKAILLALEKIKVREDRKIVMFIDSQAAIISIAGSKQTDSKCVLDCRRLANQIVSRGSILILQWIPGHCGVHGNEEADRLAKEGTLMLQEDHALCMDAAKRIIKMSLYRSMVLEQRRKAEGKQWECLKDQTGRIPSTLPREQFVACFRLLTGHDYLQGHLFKIGVARHPLCTLCQTEDIMNGTHLLICPGLRDLISNDNGEYTRKTKLYWAARKRMADVAGVPA